jgi:hypothetical protein
MARFDTDGTFHCIALDRRLRRPAAVGQTYAVQLLKHSEVSGLARVPLHDNRTDVRSLGSGRGVDRPAGQSDRDVWASPNVLLPAPHPAHPSCRVRSLARSRRSCRSVALYEPSNGPGTVAGGLHVEPATLIPGLCGVPGTSIFPMQMVRGAESEKAIETAELCLSSTRPGESCPSRSQAVWLE